MSAKAETQSDVEMVTIPDAGTLPGMSITIPKELNDKILRRYSLVLDRNVINSEISDLDAGITGLMHLHENLLPKKEGTGETYVHIPGVDGKIEAILAKTEKEKLHTTKVAADED